MATYTTRLNATKPASSENVNITTLNDNSDLFDAAVGTTVASAAAKPASAFQGRLWYETDTGFLKVNTAAAASTWLRDRVVSNGVDDAPTLNSILAASAGLGGMVRLAGNIRLGSRVTFPTGWGLDGSGNNMDGSSVGGSRILLTSASAGLT